MKMHGKKTFYGGDDESIQVFLFVYAYFWEAVVPVTLYLPVFDSEKWSSSLPLGFS